MIIGTFCFKQASNYFKKYKEIKENFNGDDDNGNGLGIAALFLGLLWLGLSIAMFILWIFTIIQSLKCEEKDRTVALIIAIFFWPLFWILRWTGVICKGGSFFTYNDGKWSVV